VLESLYVWNDPEPRNGFENMAVDELLWGTCAAPLLRVYQWEGAWLSMGYFSKLEVLREQFPSWQGGVVRRPTGGGIVDHRHDWTYSLFVPRGLPLAEMSAVESYRIFHSAIAKVLQNLGVPSVLCEDDGSRSSDLCFSGAAVNDVLDLLGNKIAGAGQRRGRAGFLQQGSISIKLPNTFAHDLAYQLSDSVEFSTPAIDSSSLAKLVTSKYACNTWTTKK